MFQSATLRLTGWYLLILMSTSLLFSVAVFESATSEINNRLMRLQTSLQSQSGFVRPFNNSLRAAEENEASTSILLYLAYTNLMILLVGGAGSYLLAGRTLRPIQEAHEAQSRFTSDASHELRTPLATMKAEIEVILRDKHASKEDLSEVLASNLEEVEKLSNLSVMLLSLSRLDHSKLERTAINLKDATSDVVKRLNLPADRIVVHTNTPSLIEGNEAAVTELIAILVDNALKYSPAESTISITLARHGHFASFEITNAGEGIPADILPRIFDRFYRADLSRTSGPQKGYGLGLALAKKIVEFHNGELTASSTPGSDTTFTVLLPLIA